MTEKSWDTEWLVFSRKSRRGAFVLLIIFILLAVAPRIYRNYFQSKDVQVKSSFLIDNEDEKNADQSSFNKKKYRKNKDDRFNGGKKEKFTYKIPAAPFDPNEYSFEDWKQIGFSDKQVQTIVNYQKKGGRFLIKSDVKKLYVIDEELYLKLKDKILLPEKLEVYESEKPKTSPGTLSVKSHSSLKININKATKEELEEIPGIGPFFAKEIVKLRESYGGLHSMEQLLKIYNMDMDKLNAVKPYFELNKNDIRTLNINTASRKELGMHPLIDWNMANSIVSIRETHGRFNSVDELLRSVLITKEGLQVIRPYLTVE
ncbi:MAG: helix-hairpin-helix domain-containing protein [Brumimicrobium sp.]|nr:helix-hairpin-helix domain-containing protein [Brumimicrobium sp.]